MNIFKVNYPKLDPPPISLNNCDSKIKKCKYCCDFTSK